MARMAVQRKEPPAVDPAILPQQRVTRDGQPLSYNRAPSPDLAPWIARLYVTKVAMPARHTISCGTLNDTPFVSMQLSGDWQTGASGIPQPFGQAALFFGPQSRRIPVTVTGSFISVGFAVRAGATTALHGPRVRDFVDKVVPTSAFDLPYGDMLPQLDPAGAPEDWLQAIEDGVRRRVEQADGALPDPIAVRFEEITFRNPATSVSEAAQLCGVERRKLERVVSRDFGLAPKQVLRRARALDMASHLRGVADLDEAEEMALRYYDESHLIHEFTDLFGMSPRQFVRTPQPILTLSLEIRQARRLETLHRITPGGSRPWD